MLAETETDLDIAFGAEGGPRCPPPPLRGPDRLAARPRPAPAASVPPDGRRADGRIVDSVRAILAFLAVGMAAEDSSGTALLAWAALLSGAYALFLLWLGRHRRIGGHPALCAVDTGCCLLLFQLSGGRPEYFLLLPFPLLLAGLRHGLGSSALLAAFAAAGASLAHAWSGGEALAIAALLFALGPGIALLNRSETRIREGIELAGRLLERLDPRTGVDALAAQALAAIAGHFGADAALLVLRAHDSRTRVFCRESGEAAGELGQAAAAAAARPILALADGLSLAASAPRRPAWLRRRRIVIGGRPGADGDTLPAAVSLEKLLNLPEVLSVPALHNETLAARLVLGRRTGRFDESAIEMAVRMLERIVPVLLYAGLLEQLAAEAAETERARIGRDLHDSAVQPYIGLKFAVEAAARRCPADAPLAAELQQLVRMVNSELASMRDVIAGLRSLRGDGEALLEAAVRRQAARFGQLFGIEVRVAIEGEMPVSRRLAQEIFHMVAEGLSNIRRHSAARHAEILLINEGDALSLCIYNAAVPGEPPPPRFEPRSIGMRARELGGSAQVSITPAGTSVTVCLPIPAAKKA